MQQIESLESSSPLVVRCVAAGLAGKSFSPYPLNFWTRAALSWLGYFPQAVGRYVISRAQPFSALPPEALENLTCESLTSARLQDYRELIGPFPAVVAGVALGGASAFLALALNAPFLPQTFVTTLKGGSPDGDVQVYFQRSARLALRLAQENPGLITIQHYDPVHDEWLTRRVNHLRFKLIALPEAYTDFIRKNLAPGGAVCYLDCQAQWLRYRIGERSFFQVGGWGDISAQEFLEGSQRLRSFARKVKLASTSWQLPDYPLETGPESEWGSEPGLDAALRAFCQQEGYQFVQIRLPEPHDFSRLAYMTMLRLLEIEHRQPAGVLIEMFSQFDPFAALQGGLLPLWLVFNTWDSLVFLKQMRPQFPVEVPVFFSPLSTFTLTPDIVPWEEWQACLAGLNWRNLGTRASHYPADTHTLIRWNQKLWEWVQANGKPVQARLEASQLAEIYQTFLRSTPD